MSEADNRTGAVVSILPNGIEQFIILFAAVNAGLDFAPLNSKATLREFTSWLRLTNASLHCPVHGPNLRENALADHMQRVLPS